MIGDNIRKYRLAKKMTQAQLASACGGRSVNQINGYERGRSRPSPALIRIIADGLGIDVATLMQEANEVNTAENSVLSLSNKLRNLVAEVNGIKSEQVRVIFEIVT